VIFPITVTSAKDVLSADALVQYDTRALKLKGIRATEQTQGFMATAMDRNGRVRIGLAGARELNGDVTLLELIFVRIGSGNPQTTVEEPRMHADDAKQCQQTQHGSVGVSVAGGKQPAVSDERTAVSPSARSAVQSGPSTAIGDALSADGGITLVWLVLNEGSPAINKLQPTEGDAMGDKTGLPASFFLIPPRPNPFGNGTRIEYGLPRATSADVSVYDATGSRVRTLVHGEQPAGRYTLTWDGRDDRARSLANGIYFVQMQAGDYRSRQKATLLIQ
jgi:hypothetical protein